MKNKNYILMVFEGEKTEKIIVDNLRKYYLNEKSNVIIYGLYCNVIYDVYEKSHDEEGELVYDILPILQEIPQNKDILKDITRDQVSEIYLFFDHDAHSHLSDIKKLDLMLEHFNNETEYGKLYISYPMVESIKHIDSKELTYLITDNKKYKKTVNDETKKEYIQINKYTKDIWQEIIFKHSKRLGFLFTDKLILLDNIFTQKEIYMQQLKKYIKPDNKVIILSSFPIFLIDYYGYKAFKTNKL